MDNRKLHTYTSIAEIVSAFAIIVSLLYAGYEFRRSATMTSREVDTLLFERFQESNRMVIETPGLAEIILTGQTNPDRLTGADWLRFETFQKEKFNTWEIAWYHHEDGILDDQTWHDWDSYFERSVRKVADTVWSEIRTDFDGEFRRHVDEAMGIEPPARP